MKDFNERDSRKRILEIYASLLSNMVPFCSGVNRILRARVPIVKFSMNCCRLSCDLSVSCRYLQLFFAKVCKSFSYFCRTSVKMAKLFWMCSKLEPRLTPLVFSLRFIAKSNKITKSTPGAHLTNFQLMCLIIFFMQNRPKTTSKK